MTDCWMYKKTFNYFSCMKQCVHWLFYFSVRVPAAILCSLAACTAWLSCFDSYCMGCVQWNLKNYFKFVIFSDDTTGFFSTVIFWAVKNVSNDPFFVNFIQRTFCNLRDSGKKACGGYNFPDFASDLRSSTSKSSETYQLEKGFPSQIAA